jgi:methionyl aminopeptidase
MKRKQNETRKIKAMRKGGAMLASIRRQIEATVKPGTKLIELDRLTETLINKAGGKPSFKMVPGYRFATCLTVNEGVVHGIPTDRKIKNGDLVSIDLGMYYQGFHTDCATTVIAGKPTAEDQKFLTVGRHALKNAIAKAKADNRIGDISKAIQSTIESAGFSCSRSLTGHGIGAKLHEEPPVPCLLFQDIKKTPKLKKGQTLAIEVIYAQGSYGLSLQNDNWTLVTEDGKKAGLFEDTILITDNKPIVLTS